MKTKTCTCCKVELPIDKFNQKKTGAQCRPCLSKKSAESQRKRREREGVSSYELLKKFRYGPDGKKKPEIAASERERRRAKRSAEIGVDWHEHQAALAFAKAQKAEIAAMNRSNAELITAIRDLQALLIADAGLTEYTFRYRTDQEFCIKERLRNMMKKHAKEYTWIHHYFGSLARRNKGRSAIWDLVGYSQKELHEHIANGLKDGMTWDDFLSGKIHIDHKIPKVAFDLSTVDGVKACYALSNLQPLWAHENLKKQSKFNGKMLRK